MDIGQNIGICRPKYQLSVKYWSKWKYRYWYRWPICWCKYIGIGIGKKYQQGEYIGIGIGWTHIGPTLPPRHECQQLCWCQWGAEGWVWADPAGAWTPISASWNFFLKYLHFLWNFACGLLFALRVGVVGVKTKLKLNLAQLELELGLSLAKTDFLDFDEFGLLFLLISKEKQYMPHCWGIFWWRSNPFSLFEFTILLSTP